MSEPSQMVKALLNAQKLIEPVPKTAEADAGSYSYKYADLAAVIRAVKQPLLDNGIVFVQLTEPSPEVPAGHVRVSTVLMHESGETLSASLDMPCSADPRSVGSAISYARRYTLQSLTGLSTEDDDAGAARGEVDDGSLLADHSAELAYLEAKAAELFETDAEGILERLALKFSIADGDHGKIKRVWLSRAIAMLEEKASQ